TGTGSTTNPPTTNPPTSKPPPTNTPPPQPTTSAPPTPGNPRNDRLLSYNKPATASSFQNENGCANCSPAKAVDNDPATRWATSSINGWVDPGWIYVDLGATATIHSVMLQWDPAFATAYQLQVSPNAS